MGLENNMLVGVGVELPCTTQPSPTCPACDAPRIPPESDEGLPPSHQWKYRCDSGYWADDEVQCTGWQPTWPCWRFAPEYALAWLPDANRNPRLKPLLEQICDVPPFRNGRLVVALAPFRAQRTPEACPCCGAAPERACHHIASYRCGASVTVSVEAPDSSGELRASAFYGLSACASPPLRAILRTIRVPSRQALVDALIAASDA